MNVLVTGGAGFIGSHVCEAMMADRCRVSIIDDLNDFYDPSLKRENLAALAEKGEFAFYQGDIRDSRLVQAVFEQEQPGVVVHLAARAGVRPSLQKPKLYFSTNVDGTLNILEAMRRQAVPKLVFASSSSVYGDRAAVPFRETDAVARPISPYAATKLAGEQLVYTYAHLYGIRAICLRFFTVYGPRQRPDLAIRRFYELMQAGKPVTMFGDGSTGRDYTFISDIVDGILAALRCEARYEIVNLGNSRPVLLSELIAELGRVLKVQPVVIPASSQPGDVGITFADTSKAEALLGYRPSVDFAEGIRCFNAWMEGRKTPAWPHPSCITAEAGMENQL
jgi:UDP-glucuronate 4-epimerase